MRKELQNIHIIDAYDDDDDFDDDLKLRTKLAMLRYTVRSLWSFVQSYRDAEIMYLLVTNVLLLKKEEKRRKKSLRRNLYTKCERTLSNWV